MLKRPTFKSRTEPESSPPSIEKKTFEHHVDRIGFSRALLDEYLRDAQKDGFYVKIDAHSPNNTIGPCLFIDLQKRV